MLEVLDRRVLREGYTVLLIAERRQDLPSSFLRLFAWTDRTAKRRFERLVAREGERVARAFAALTDNRERARWRVERLTIETTSAWIDAIHLRVICMERLDGAILGRTEWIWNTEEETLLPPGQVRRLTRCSKVRQKINKITDRNHANPLAKSGKV